MSNPTMYYNKYVPFDIKKNVFKIYHAGFFCIKCLEPLQFTVLPAPKYIHRPCHNAGLAVKLPASLFDPLSIYNTNYPGAHFTNAFSVAIQLRRKLRFDLTSVLTKWSIHNFVHDKIALLSSHVQKFVAIWWSVIGLQQSKLSNQFELRAKFVSGMARAPRLSR